MKKLLLSLIMVLASFTTQASEDLMPKQVRWCANMSVNYVALGISAQLLDDKDKKAFTDMVAGQAKKVLAQSGNQDAADMITGFGEMAWANRKIDMPPVRIGMMIYDACVAQIGIRT